MKNLITAFVLIFLLQNVLYAQPQIDLSSFTICNTTTVPQALNDYSGVCYNYDTGTLFGVNNKTEVIVETDLEGNYIRTIDLVGFDDTEAIVYFGNDLFGVVEEDFFRVVFITIPDSPNDSSINHPGASSAITISGIGGGGDGLEGVTYDAANDVLYLIKEISTMGIYQVANPLSNIGTVQPANPVWDLLATAPSYPSPMPNGVTDVSGLSMTPYGTLLLLSDEGKSLLEIDLATGLHLSSFNLSSMFQPEGVIAVHAHHIIVVGEPNQFAILRRDSDNDGTCDIFDLCGALDDNLIGTPCDDGYPCTTNDIYIVTDAGSADCACLGTPVPDSDNDGICDALDLCANLDDNLLGTPCNDGNPCTVNDLYAEVDGTSHECDCFGTPVPDSDNDGICDVSDPCPNDPINNCYCASQGATSYEEYIGLVAIGSIENYSGDNGGYADFTNLSTDVYSGSTVNISLTPEFLDTPFTEYWKVWIDFNQNNEFDESTEEVFSADGISVVSGTINIPSSIAGTTRMRVSMKYGGDPTPCETFGYGEVEDYTINIIDCPLVNQSCNDGDPCTINDTYNIFCNCIGTPTGDSDGDGVCNAIDQCGLLDDDLLGTPCNDGDPCTINDVYSVWDAGSADCACTGTPTGDSDNDGICDALDQCPNQDDTIDSNNDGTPDCLSPCFNNNIVTVVSPITSGNDDVEESETNGDIYATSTDLELVYDTYSSFFNQHIGTYFRNLNIPQGATILNAYIQFTTDEAVNEAGALTIYAEDTSNPAPFSSTAYDVSSRTKTTTGVTWDPPTWNIVGEAGADQQTPDLSSIIQELTNRSDWTSASNIVLMINGIGKRVARSADNSAGGAPVLHIEYTISADGDFDGDGICDNVDTCQGGEDTLDTDNDGICDFLDTCPNDPTNTCVYCSSYGLISNDEYIYSVHMGAIDNTSGDNGGYADFTNMSTVANIGSTIYFTLTPGFYHIEQDFHWKIWIDFNQDNDFTDANEEVFAYDSWYPIEGSIQIPSTALLGTTRMRISLKTINFSEPCEIMDWGEVEDYTITIVDCPLFGQSCNDGDPCTIGETYDLNCDCSGGAFQDSDGDGICNAFDQCGLLDDNLLGTPCNDGDPCTINDVYSVWDAGSAECACTGTPTGDSDNDGICDALDQCPNQDDTIDSDNDGIPDCLSPCFTTESLTLQSQIRTSQDDAEENQTTGAIYFTSTDIEFVFDPANSANNQHVGLYFRNINIPHGATIEDARLELTVDEAINLDGTIKIYAEDADAPSPFTQASYDISSRPLTSSFSSWNPSNWTPTVGEKITTPDFQVVIQEVVDRSGWTASSNIALIINGSGRRVFESYDGSPNDAPKLLIQYKLDNTGDYDGDGICDAQDICQNGNDTEDTDADGIPDACDICSGGDDSIDTNNNGIPDFCETPPCIPYLAINTSIGNGLQSAISIFINIVIEANQNVELNAEDYIELGPGFEVELGAECTIEIEDCTN